MKRDFFAVLTLILFGASGCERGSEEPARVGGSGSAQEGMVWIPGGEFRMGSDGELAQPNETPPHTVRIKDFYMDATEVTNAQFRKFAEATGYLTVAEKDFDPEDYPNAALEDLKAGSLVFTPSEGPVPLDYHMRWWTFTPGANWRHPSGPGSSIEGMDDHPVVCVAWEDARAYAEWAGKRLPTEAEWEFAARGGLADAPYAWGDSFEIDGAVPANLWQGDFPYDDTGEDGFKGTAPVKQYPPNGYGLYDISGNVWEFVQDWYDPDYYMRSPEFNPLGPTEELVMDFSKRLRWHSDTRESLKIAPHKVIRGGSFLCNDCYCLGYRPTARQVTDMITATNHTGFRCVKSPS